MKNSSYRTGRGPLCVPACAGILPKLLFITRDELPQRSRQPLDARVAHDAPFADLKEHLLLAALGIGVQ